MTCARACLERERVAGLARQTNRQTDTQKKRQSAVAGGLNDFLLAAIERTQLPVRSPLPSPLLLLFYLYVFFFGNFALLLTI